MPMREKWNPEPMRAALREVLGKNGELNKSAVAAEIGMSPKQLTNILTKTRAPGIDVLWAISERYRVSLYKLLGLQPPVSEDAEQIERQVRRLRRGMRQAVETIEDAVDELRDILDVDGSPHEVVEILERVAGNLRKEAGLEKTNEQPS